MYVRMYVSTLHPSIHVQDFENACTAYDQAIKVDGNDALIHLNYAITLYSNDEVEKAEEHCTKYETLSAAAVAAKVMKNG